jgi:PIN domain nuclease of toxin-antitoxin system
VKLLLDTCCVLWALQDAQRLSAPARTALRDPINTILVSPISFWEISLKSALGKLTLHQASPEDIPDFALDAGWEIHPLSSKTAASVGRLPQVPRHRDPFDRLLVWTAISENIHLVSRDNAMALYAPHGLKTCW